MIPSTVVEITALLAALDVRSNGIRTMLMEKYPHNACSHAHLTQRVKPVSRTLASYPIRGTHLDDVQLVEQGSRFGGVSNPRVGLGIVHPE